MTTINQLQKRGRIKRLQNDVDNSRYLGIDCGEVEQIEAEIKGLNEALAEWEIGELDYGADGYAWKY